MFRHQPTGRRLRLVVLPALLMLLVLAAPGAAGAATTSGSGVTGLPGPGQTAGGTATATSTAATSTAVTTVTKTVTKTVAASGSPVLVTDPNTPPSGYHLTANKVLRIASADPRVKAELRRHPKAIPYEYTKGAPTWQVSWFSNGKPQRELLQVYVDDNTGAVTQAWTGFQVAWTMARGYAGAFGRRVNAWYLWVPLCILFVAPFIPWRRRPSLLAPGPAGAAQLLDLAGLLQPREDRALGPAGLPAAHLPDGAPVLRGQRARASRSDRCAPWRRPPGWPSGPCS